MSFHSRVKETLENLLIELDARILSSEAKRAKSGREKRKEIIDAEEHRKWVRQTLIAAEVGGVFTITPPEGFSRQDMIDGVLGLYEQRYVPKEPQYSHAATVAMEMLEKDEHNTQ